METWAQRVAERARLLRPQPHRRRSSGCAGSAAGRVRLRSTQASTGTRTSVPRAAWVRAASSRDVADERPTAARPPEHGAQARRHRGGGARRAGRGVRGPAVRAALLRAPGRRSALGREPDTALVEALWTGALVGYVRCFSAPDQGAHRRRPQRAPARRRRHRVPRAWSRSCATTTPPGTQPARDVHDRGRRRRNDGAADGRRGGLHAAPAGRRHHVRLLGRVAYALSGLLDARMQQSAGAGAGARPGGSRPASSPALPLRAPVRRPDRLTGTRASASRYSYR